MLSVSISLSNFSIKCIHLIPSCVRACVVYVRICVCICLCVCLLVMHRYEILPIFRLTDIAFPILADTDSRSDINLASKSIMGITVL